jgi:hypothetical protein
MSNDIKTPPRTTQITSTFLTNRTNATNVNRKLMRFQWIPIVKQLVTTVNRPTNEHKIPLITLLNCKYDRSLSKNGMIPMSIGNDRVNTQIVARILPKTPKWTDFLFVVYDNVRTI